MKLTAKQTRFIDEYMIDRNGAAAAVRAGYSARCAKQAAHENLTKPDVLTALGEREREDATRLEITRHQVLNGFLAAFEMAKANADPGGMIAAMRQLGLMLGFYAPDRKAIEVSTAQHGWGARMEAMTDAELIQILKADLPELPNRIVSSGSMR